MSNSPENSACLYAELRRRIGAVQVVILISKRKPSQIHTEVYPQSIEIGLHGDNKASTQIFNFPTSLRLNPRSCQGLQWVNGEGIHMRLQLSTDEGSILGSDECVGRIESSALETEMKAVRESDGVMMKCSQCGGILLPSSRCFSRVFPLPSENWREMSSDWCCHGNDHTRSLAESSLVPNIEDCFMSDLYLSVSPLIMDKTAVVIPEVKGQQDDESKTLQAKSPILCQRCRHVLGDAILKGGKTDPDTWNQVESVHLYKHSLLVSSDKQLQHGGLLDSNNIFRNYSLEVFLANHFVTLSSSQTTFKFIVESLEDNQTILLVWLLSTDTLLLRSRMTTDASCLEPFTGDDEDDDKVSAESNSKGNVLQCLKIAKILYQHKQEEQFQKTNELWTKDFGVETVRLPTHTCMELLLLLATSTERTPPSLRHMNGFKVGYLRLNGSDR